MGIRNKQVWNHLPILVNEKHLSLFMAVSLKPESGWLGSNQQLRTWKERTLPIELHPRLWTHLESNQAPNDYESFALTEWAIGPKVNKVPEEVLINFTQSFSVTAPLRIRHVSMWFVNLHCLFRHSGIFLFWWRISESNRWPSACKADALANWANPPIH